VISRVLIVEDKDGKFQDLLTEVQAVFPDASVVRAQTVVEAERYLGTGSWDLLVLDVSMDISGASKGAFGGGHANLGALDILDTMFFEEIECPTVVVTGFDYFVAAGSGDEAEFLGIGDLADMVEKRLPRSYLGCLRYGREGWQVMLRTIIEGVGV
jgi:hypothetical protein